MSEPKKEGSDPYKFFTGIDQGDWNKISDMHAQHQRTATEEVQNLRAHLEAAKVDLIDAIVVEEKDPTVQKDALRIALEILQDALSIQMRQYQELDAALPEAEKEEARKRITDEAHSKLDNLVRRSVERARQAK